MVLFSLICIEGLIGCVVCSIPVSRSTISVIQCWKSFTFIWSAGSRVVSVVQYPRLAILITAVHWMFSKWLSSHQGGPTLLCSHVCYCPSCLHLLSAGKFAARISRILCIVYMIWRTPVGFSTRYHPAAKVSSRTNNTRHHRWNHRIQSVFTLHYVYRYLRCNMYLCVTFRRKFISGFLIWFRCFTKELCVYIYARTIREYYRWMGRHGSWKQTEHTLVYVLGLRGRVFKNNCMCDFVLLRCCPWKSCSCILYTRHHHLSVLAQRYYTYSNGKTYSAMCTISISINTPHSCMIRFYHHAREMGSFRVCTSDMVPS